MAYIITRPEGKRVLMFDPQKRLVRIIGFTEITPDAAHIQFLDDEERLVSSCTLPFQWCWKLGWETKLAYYGLTRGKKVFGKFGFTGPKSVTILPEEKCRSHELPAGYIVKPY